MELKKFSIDIEKLRNIKIFSCDSYILGYRDKIFSYRVSFFPILINKDNLDFLNVYFNFIDEATWYSDGGNYYPPSYDVYFKNYNKVYKDCSRYDIMDLLELSDTDIVIIPEESIEVGTFIHDLLKEISILDDKFSLESFYDEDKKVLTKILSIDNSNYVEVSVDYFENVSMNYNYIFYEKEIKEAVEILEHILAMYDKNLGK